MRARANPSEIPTAPPASSPSSDSSSVTARWPHGVPLPIHRAIRAPMSLGRLTKNGSSTLTETSACHAPRNATPMASCQKRTTPGPKGPGLRPEREPFRRASRFTALDHFLAEDCPDASKEIDERRQRAQLHQVARPLERDVVLRDHVRGGTGREDDDAIGERDGLLEIVGDEHDRFSRGADTW